MFFISSVQMEELFIFTSFSKSCCNRYNFPFHNFIIISHFSLTCRILSKSISLPLYIRTLSNDFGLFQSIKSTVSIRLIFSERISVIMCIHYINFIKIANLFCKLSNFDFYIYPISELPQIYCQVICQYDMICSRPKRSFVFYFIL